MHPSLSIVIPFRNRDEERLRRAVLSSAESMGSVPGEIIVVDYGSDDVGLARRAVSGVENAQVLRVEATTWNKSEALNLGIAFSKSDYILVSDGDLFWPRGTISHAFQTMRASIDEFLAFDVRYLREETPTELLSQGADPQLLGKWGDLNPRWGDGICLFPKSSWRDVGGYDERLSVYGYEDNDFTRRLRASGLTFRWADFSRCPVFHVWHEPVGKVVAKKKPSVDRAYSRNRQIYNSDFSVVRNAVGEGVDSSPLVSVVIATSGRQALLEEALCSILCQTVQNFEVIVVDDGQVDDSESVVASFDDKRFVYVGLSERRGISYARNIGTKRARGQFIAVMDDDDICLPDRFSTSLASITRGVDGCVGSFITFYESDGRVVSWDDPAPTVEGAFAIGGFAGHPTWMIRRSVFEQFSYDESFSSAVDNNRALRMLNSGVQLVHSGEPHILRRVHEGQVSNKDQQFQGFGALLDKTWLWSGYARSEYNSLKSRSEESRPRNAPVLYESRFLPYLPDDLVSRQIDVDVWNRSDFEFCKSLEVAGPWFALESEDGEFVYGKIRVEGTWRNMARVSQRRLRFAIVCFEPKPTLSAKDYVKQEQEFSPAVPWDEIGWRDDLERLKVNTSGEDVNWLDDFAIIRVATNDRIQYRLSNIAIELSEVRD